MVGDCEAVGFVADGLSYSDTMFCYGDKISLEFVSIR